MLPLILPKQIEEKLREIIPKDLWVSSSLTPEDERALSVMDGQTYLFSVTINKVEYTETFMTPARRLHDMVVFSRSDYSLVRIGRHVAYDGAVCMYDPEFWVKFAEKVKEMLELPKQEAL